MIRSTEKIWHIYEVFILQFSIKIYFGSLDEGLCTCMRILRPLVRRSRGGGAGVWTPTKNHKVIWFLRNTSPDPLKNHKATKSAFNVGQTWARQRNAMLLFIMDMQVENVPILGNPGVTQSVTLHS